MINTSLNAPADYVDLSVQAGQTYFYVVTSVDSGGVESLFSSQVQALIP
jgi:fibronectin type 3 domain-containing protein